MSIQTIWIVAAAEGTTDWTFLLILAALLVAGAGLVVWSRKRGLKKAEPEPEEAEETAIAPVKPEAEEAQPEPEEEPQPEGLLLPEGRSIQDGLAKTRSQGFVGRLRGLFSREIDENLEERIEEVLLTSDIGVRTAQKLLNTLRDELDRKELSDPDRVWSTLRDTVAGLVSAGQPEEVAAVEPPKPKVIVVVGVNGTGKTTTVGKLASRFKAEGKKVMLVAADTFRAAASDQLEVWSKRSDVLFHTDEVGKDPASVAFDGIKLGMDNGADIIMVDTAGRLHTKKNLLEELKKIVRVAGKACPGAPHETLLVLDATTGQNAIQQAEIFHGEVGINALVLTKLDGTAKGGVVIGICDMMKIPVRYIGVGEAVEDLQPFDATAFVDGLFAHRDGEG